MKRALLLIWIAAAALAQQQSHGTEPKARAEEYDVHGTAMGIGVGAEFTVHSFSGEGETYVTADFLIVEVALYPPQGATAVINLRDFGLRINGKPAIAAMQPTMVAMMLNRADWNNRPRLQAEGGLGNTSVILGAPRPQGPYPGSPPPTVGTPRTPPRAPDADPPGGVDRKPRVTAEELVVKVALPQGEYPGPVSGFLYFPFKGKSSSVKALELLYQGVSFKLR